MWGGSELRARFICDYGHGTGYGTVHLKDDAGHWDQEANPDVHIEHHQQEEWNVDEDHHQEHVRDCAAPAAPMEWQANCFVLATEPQGKKGSDEHEK
jgi:hypothetical protein